MKVSELEASNVCRQCQCELAADDAFCESCGAATGRLPAEPPEITGTAPTSSLPDAIAADVDATQTQPNPIVRICAACQGLIAADGYCGSCGAKGRTERDHWNEHPVPWAAAVCDRGIRHHRNEDAVALVASEAAGSFAALVVCDGVSTSSNSDVASLAAVHAAVAVLSGVASETASSFATRLVSISAAIERAGADAQMVVAAVTATEMSEHPSPPSCTFVAAVLSESLIVAGWVGDSRAYWLPDAGGAEMLSVDHSVASEMIRAGATREAAETSPDAHAITRWLGVDAPNAVPQIATTMVRCAGWLLVCSDGLWNYCSDPFAVDALLRELATSIGGAEADSVDPCALGEALVAWANTQGGHDNISVVLARVPAPKPE